MGRYYNTNTGRGGKFGFGCQNSTDPREYFDMVETHITYTAGEESQDFIRGQLDKVYEQAKVPKGERVYTLNELEKAEDEYESFHNAYHKYFFEKCKPGEGNFAGDDGTTEREVFDNAHLAQSRLWLGLIILSDINEEGYCELDAEL